MVAAVLRALGRARQPRRALGAALVAVLALVVGGCSQVEPAADEPPAVVEIASEAAPGQESRPTAPTEPTAPAAAAPEAPAEPAAPPPGGVPEEAQPAVVEHVTDGDTIHVRVDEPGGALQAGASHTVRLLEIDTPETKHPQRGVECGGPEASAFTAAELAVGSTVYLVADVGDTDRYGRFLRYVWTADGTFFNEAAVLAGHARAVLYEPNDAHIERLRAAEADARAARRGLWGSCEHADGEAAPPSRGAAQRPAAPAPGDGCAPGYDPCVPAFPPDVDCADVTGPITVTGPDPHALDGDGDGRGCEG